jgi:pre-mRNA cleavage complex 2 protein Pcf11
MLRKAMQQILDDLQSDVQDELEKVSLERLALIDPDLLAKIKGTAEESLGTNGTSVGGGPTSRHEEHDALSFLIETRPPDTINRSKAWGKLDLNFLKETHELITTLQQLVRGESSSETTYTQSEAIEMTGAVASAACTATILTNALHQIQHQDENTKSGELGGLFGTGSLNGGKGPTSRGFLAVDRKLFTSQGVKQKNDTVVGILYEIGLPFVSSSDGRRFSTQLELSNHLDALFKKGYVGTFCLTELVFLILF